MEDRYERRSAILSAAVLPVDARYVSGEDQATEAGARRTSELQRVNADRLVRSSRPVMPDLVDEVLGREDELEIALIRRLRERPAGAVVEECRVDADLAVLRKLRGRGVSERRHGRDIARTSRSHSFQFFTPALPTFCSVQFESSCLAA